MKLWAGLDPSPAATDATATRPQHKGPTSSFLALSFFFFSPLAPLEAAEASLPSMDSLLCGGPRDGAAIGGFRCPGSGGAAQAACACPPACPHSWADCKARIAPQAPPLLFQPPRWPCCRLGGFLEGPKAGPDLAAPLTCRVSGLDGVYNEGIRLVADESAWYASSSNVAVRSR
jgi:hypothetical protein